MKRTKPSKRNSNKQNNNQIKRRENDGIMKKDRNVEKESKKKTYRKE